MRVVPATILAVLLAGSAAAAGPGAPALLPADELRTQLKALGAEPDPALDALIEASHEGRTDAAAQDAVLASIADPAARRKARWLLAQPGERDAIIGGRSDLSPSLGGVCLTCPASDFGPFGMTAAYQTHCSQTATDSDCNTYLFDVTPGTTAEFTTCAPGSATFDTYLRVMRADTCQVLAVADDECGVQSRTVLLVPAGVTQLFVQVSGSPGGPAFGDYCLAWRESPPCATCVSPRPGVYAPDRTCGQITDSVNACRDNFYQFLLIAGRPYEFSTCWLRSVPCNGSTLGDSVIEIYSPSSCTVAARNDDAPSCASFLASYLMFTPVTTGVHLVRVREAFNRSSLFFTLAFAELDCDVPSVASVTPASGTVAAGSCSRAQTFDVALTDGLSADAYWTITAPPGGTAVPASGWFPISGSGSFTSTLVRGPCPGGSDFGVTVRVTRLCGSDEETFIYSLADTIPPRIAGCPASRLLDCADPVPPAPSPTATDNCDPAPVMSFSEATVPGSCPGNFSIVRTWTATDCSGNTQRCLQNIVLRDRTPPSLAGANAWCMHPVNHEYYCVTPAELAVAMSDDCSPPVRLVFTGCTSSEPDTGTSPDDMPDDCIIAPDGSEACFRVERAGTVVDRAYVLTGVAIDACGNRSVPQPIALATVPRDDAPHPECVPSDSGIDKHY